MLFGGILLIANIASAQTWTHVASACLPDESSMGLYQFDNGTVSFKQNAPVGSTIKLRCNVTSPIDGTFLGSPAWGQLEIGFKDLVGGLIHVQLVRVAQTNGLVAVLANFVSPAGGPTVAVVPIAAGAFDFINNAYFVAINLTKPAEGVASPTVWYVGTTL